LEFLVQDAGLVLVDFLALELDEVLFRALCRGALFLAVLELVFLLPPEWLELFSLAVVGEDLFERVRVDFLAFGKSFGGATGGVISWMSDVNAWTWPT
jgi:hypothetical protein